MVLLEIYECSISVHKTRWGLWHTWILQANIRRWVAVGKPHGQFSRAPWPWSISVSITGYRLRHVESRVNTPFPWEPMKIPNKEYRIRKLWQWYPLAMSFGENTEYMLKTDGVNSHTLLSATNGSHQPPSIIPITEYRIPITLTTVAPNLLLLYVGQPSNSYSPPSASQSTCSCSRLTHLPACNRLDLFQQNNACMHVPGMCFYIVIALTE